MHGAVALVCHPLQLLRGLCALVGRFIAVARLSFWWQPGRDFVAAMWIMRGRGMAVWQQGKLPVLSTPCHARRCRLVLYLLLVIPCINACCAQICL